MAKRFTDTNKYKKPFIRSLKGAYKLLWDYLYHDCDHAGIWIVDFPIAQIYIGVDMPVSREEAIQVFNNDEERIIEIDKGKKWFIPSFIEFQYGTLAENNRAHKSVITILQKYQIYDLLGANKGLIRSLQGRKDKDKDKDKDKEGGLGEFNPLMKCPEFQAVKAEAEKIGYIITPEEADYFIAHYKAQGWRAGNGAIIKDWRPLLTKWKVNEPNFKNRKGGDRKTSQLQGDQPGKPKDYDENKF